MSPKPGRAGRGAVAEASASSEGTWSPKGTTVRSDSAASSPVQKVMEDAAEQRKEDAQNYKAEFREWASELEVAWTRTITRMLDFGWMSWSIMVLSCTSPLFLSVEMF